MMAAILAVILAAGCTSTTPEKETSNISNAVKVNITEPQAEERYVELNMLDGSKIGGKYISKSAAFVTIVPMYVLDKDGFMSVGSGKDVGIKTSLVNTMVNVGDPSLYMETTLKAQSDKAAALEAAEKLAKEKKAEEIRRDKEKQAEELDERMPTKSILGKAIVRDTTVGNATVGNATVGNATVGNATVGNATVGNATWVG